MPVNGSSYDYTYNFDGSTDDGYNVGAPGTIYEGSTGSEMAYLSYIELGNLGYRDISGNPDQPGWGIQNRGPFTKISAPTWSGTMYAPDPDKRWLFNFANALQADVEVSNQAYVWAVRTVIPEPMSSILFIVGGLFLIRGRCLKRKNRA